MTVDECLHKTEIPCTVYNCTSHINRALYTNKEWPEHSGHAINKVVSVLWPYNIRMVGALWPYKIRVTRALWPYEIRVTRALWPYEIRVTRELWPYEIRVTRALWPSNNL